MKHLLKMADLSKKDIENMLDLADKLKYEKKHNITHHILKGQSLGMLFRKSSTRTRVSFEVGMYDLGGNALFLSPRDLQIGRGESVKDTARVFSRFLDGLMIRTFEQSEVEAFANYGSIPVINGLTDYCHPCQVLADLLTIKEHKGTLKGLKLAYLGDGNNMANSLLYGCTKVGMNISVASPEKYTCPSEVIENAKNTAKETGVTVEITTDAKSAIKDADVVYTDTWISMGQEDQKAEKIKLFGGYQVNKELFSLAKDDAIFLHCLPAYRGYEVTEDVIDGKNSVIFDEAENRLHAQKAVMALLMGKEKTVEKYLK